MVNIAVCYENKEDLYYMAKVIYNSFKNKGHNIELDVFYESERIMKSYDNTECIYDIIFVGVNMATNNGVKLAEHVRKKDSKVILIFLGTINEDIVEIFKYKPFRFIRKDHINKDIDEAISRITEELQEKNEYFYFKTKYEKIRVRTEDIVYLEISNRKLKIKTMNNCYISNLRKLKDIAEKLKDKNFVKIHRGCMVNVKYIKSISKQNIILYDAEELIASRYRIGDIEMAFGI